MNKEKQRIAIAEAINWHPTCTTNGGDMRGAKWSLMPDYPHDLNAMHAAWETLSPTLQTAFSSVLFDVCGSWHAAANASAEQRAEAFLRTIGKWEDA